MGFISAMLFLQGKILEPVESHKEHQIYLSCSKLDTDREYYSSYVVDMRWVDCITNSNKNSHPTKWWLEQRPPDDNTPNLTPIRGMSGDWIGGQHEKRKKNMDGLPVRGRGERWCSRPTPVPYDNLQTSSLSTKATQFAVIYSPLSFPLSFLDPSTQR